MSDRAILRPGSEVVWAEIVRVSAPGAVSRDEGTRRSRGGRSLPLEDRHLAARAAEGDHEAFTLLVERYRGYVYTIAYRVVLNEDDALDISQNVFARLFERIGKFDGRGAFKGWLATMTARMAIDFTRRPARRETATEPGALDAMRDRRDDRNAYAAREALESEQRRQMIEASMLDLSP